MSRHILSLSKSKPSCHGCDLPHELYGQIIQFVSNRSDLLVLLYVSKAVHVEAKRILYESVDLAYNHLRIFYWFQMIASSPYLALLVRSLTFGLDLWTVSTPTRPLLQVIAKGLRSLINLKELNLNKLGIYDLPNAWILYKTPFQLRMFRNRLFDLRSTVSFLQSQPHITTWENLSAKRFNGEVLSGLLPLLSNAAMPSWLLPTYGSRNIVRLHTMMGYEDTTDEGRTIKSFVAYGRTLTVLVLERWVLDQGTTLQLADFIAGLSENLPVLENFSFWHQGPMRNDSSADSVMQSCSTFARLTTLSIFPPECKTPDSFYLNILTPQAALKTASLFLRQITPLTRISFSSKYPVGEVPWYAKSRKVAKGGDIVIG